MAQMAHQYSKLTVGQAELTNSVNWEGYKLVEYVRCEEVLKSVALTLHSKSAS